MSIKMYIYKFKRTPQKRNIDKKKFILTFIIYIDYQTSFDIYTIKKKTIKIIHIIVNYFTFTLFYDIHENSYNSWL